MKAIIQLSLFLLLFTSCGVNRVYTTASYGSLKSYTEKQHYVDKKTTETYVSGDLSFGRHMQESGAFDDSKTIASLNLHRNTTGRFYNYYYGFGAAMGTYKFEKGYKELIDGNDKHGFYNINLKTGINYTYSRPKVDYRFIGLELAYTNEFGDYQKKLSDLSKEVDDDLIVVNQKSMFSYHFYSEYAFKLTTEKAITFGFFAGGLIGLKETDMYSGETAYNGFSFGLRLDKYSVHLIHESGQQDIRSTKFGLTYQL